MNRIFDMPNHAHYGPVRRLFVALSTLFADKIEVLDRAYYAEWGINWDHDLSFMLDGDDTRAEVGSIGVAEAQRQIVQNAIVAIDNWYAP